MKTYLTTPQFWSRDYFGLMASYWIVGIFEGLKGLIYPLVVVLNGKSPSFQTSAGQLIVIFWSYKFFYGFVTDFVPIFGYRRKIYILGGHTASILICFLIAAVTESVTIEVTLALMTLQNFFSVFADVASDGFTVQLAQRESELNRGKTQTYVYSTRFTANIVGYLASGILLNGPTFHGQFSFEVSQSEIFIVYGCFAAIVYPLLIFCLKEERFQKYEGCREATYHPHKRNS